MMAYGIDLKTKKKQRNTDSVQKELVGPHCPFCKMVNMPDTQFCSSCDRPLSIITYDKIAKELEKLRAEQVVWQAERDKKTLEQIEWRQKQLEDRMAANYDRLYEEVMRLSSARLAGIKDERDREEEMNALGVSGVAALDKIEMHEEQEVEAAARLEEDDGDDDPLADDIDYTTELEIAEER
jgi:hypothetical protein